MSVMITIHANIRNIITTFRLTTSTTWEAGRKGV